MTHGVEIRYSVTDVPGEEEWGGIRGRSQCEERARDPPAGALCHLLDDWLLRPATPSHPRHDAGDAELGRNGALRTARWLRRFRERPNFHCKELTFHCSTYLGRFE